MHPGSYARLICLLLFPGLTVLGADSGAEKAASTKPALRLQPDDVVAFVGGGDVAASQETGHLETLLAIQFRGQRIHFRNFGWEGDTVFSQPRDFGFPSLAELLDRARVSVIILQFGRLEALQGQGRVAAFTSAYEELLDRCFKQTGRLVLSTPPPFESAGESLPDLSRRNSDLQLYVEAIRGIARKRGVPLIDLFSAFQAKKPPGGWTENGLQISPVGHALLAAAFAKEAGWQKVAMAAGQPRSKGDWPNDSFEEVRRAVREKNRLWFNYWRPQNWAFLGGDRTTQPSSRDHRNPAIRWFPEEMEKYLPLIARAEDRVEAAAVKVSLP